MLAEERLSRIMKLLSQQRTATVQELCEALNASRFKIKAKRSSANMGCCSFPGHHLTVFGDL